jgi:2-polyprenyl-3-methyl-5-hydroxy-6-metoxy-1,4-benzoquinol methylase
MAGGFEARAADNEALFRRLEIAPGGSGRALDLGCGSGFQAVALARRGFTVTAVDLSDTLLAELKRYAAGLAVETVAGDIVDAASFGAGYELAVCMGDTLTHLVSKDDVAKMFAGCRSALDGGGRLIVGWRDLTHELDGLDRFIRCARTPKPCSLVFSNTNLKR